MNLLPIGLDTDGSLSSQRQLAAYLVETVPLVAVQKDLRLWANERGLKNAREIIWALRKKYTDPWLAFLGSGDFHHLSALLIESLRPEVCPVTVILIDNHPDWFVYGPPYHCGNWVSQILKLAWVKQVFLVGQDSPDISGGHFWKAPFKELREGRICLYPYARKKACVPFQWPSQVLGVRRSLRRFYGVDLYFDTVSENNPKKFFLDLAVRLKGENIYISVDKDCLRRDETLTDWDQGGLKVSVLLDGIEQLTKTGRVVGADICGEQAPEPLKGIFKRIDSGRFFKKENISAETKNQCQETNLSLLKVFCTAAFEASS